MGASSRKPPQILAAATESNEMRQPRNRGRVRAACSKPPAPQQHHHTKIIDSKHDCYIGPHYIRVTLISAGLCEQLPCSHQIRNSGNMPCTRCAAEAGGRTAPVGACAANTGRPNRFTSYTWGNNQLQGPRPLQQLHCLNINISVYWTLAGLNPTQANASKNHFVVCPTLLDLRCYLQMICIVSEPGWACPCYSHTGDMVDNNSNIT